jgi:hypothetical protein
MATIGTAWSTEILGKKQYFVLITIIVRSMKKSGAVAALVLGAFLAGCGGGGTSNSAAEAPTIANPEVLRAEGVYRGTFSDGLVHETVVLETGQIYMIYGTRTNNILEESGVIEGPGSINNGSFSATDTRNYRNAVVTRDLPAFQEIENDQVFPAPISATYNTNGGFNGTVSTGGTTIAGRVLTQPFNVTFTGTRPDKAIYDYDAPANLSSVVGSWGQLRIVAIRSDGLISLSSRECAAEGTIKPRASGKNVFDIEWTFLYQPACPYYGQAIKSVGFVRSLEPGPLQVESQFIIVSTDSARTTKRTYIFYR